MARTLLILLGLTAVALAQPAGEDARLPEGRSAPSDDDVRERFAQARIVMLRGDAASAAELFGTLASHHPRAEVADDCVYWAGRCLLRVPDREPDAVVAFLRLIREYPESPFVDDAARELALLGDRTVVPELERRATAGGERGRLARAALLELTEPEPVSGGLEKKADDGDETARAERADRDGRVERPAPRAPGEAGSGPAGEARQRRGTPSANRPEEDEEARLERLEEEVAVLTRRLEEALALLKQILAERERLAREAPKSAEPEPAEPKPAAPKSAEPEDEEER